MQRVRVFVDFWNFLLSVRASCKLPIEVDWGQFGLRAAQALGRLPGVHLGGDFRCEGTHIYGSYSTADRWQHELAKQMIGTHALLPGVFPVFERREKRTASRTCGSCGSTVTLSQEEGIDVRLAIDAIKFSHFDPEAIILLATNDGDFIPLVDYLAGMGRKIVHLRPKNGNDDLSRRCWGNLSLEMVGRSAFPFEERVVLIKVANGSGYHELENLLKKHGEKYDVFYLEKTKGFEMELYRIFADNQAYKENFDGLEDECINIHGIENAIELAVKRPELLHGPFLLYRKNILNRHKICREFKLQI